MNEKVAEAILDTPGCFKSKSNKPSIMSNRQLTPYYINPRVINSYPVQRDIVIEEMIDLIDRSGEIGGNLDKLVTTIHGLPICSAVGDRLGVGIAYLPKVKWPGRRKDIEGYIESGDDVVGVDNLIIEEKPVASVVDAVRDSLADIDDYCVVFNRNHSATKLLSDLNVKLHALAELSTDFIVTALKKEKITGKEYESFKEYSENPVEWSKNYILKNPEYIKTRLSEVVEGGKIKDMAPLEILTIGHPTLKDEYEPIVRRWLTELGVRHNVPEFDYKVGTTTNN